MNHIFTTFSAVMIALPAIVSCVHEYPVNGGVDPTLTNAKVRLVTTPAFTESSVVETKNNDGNGFDNMYFVVEFHKDEFGPSPVIRREIGKEKDDDNSARVELNETLPAGKYKCVAYAVAATDVDGSGSIFSLDDLSNIGFPDDYPGNTDAKECYEARFDIDLTSGAWLSDVEMEKQMTSPMGHVRVLSTDAEDFIKHEMTRLQLSSTNPQVSSWQWSDYHVVWKYDMYYPVNYNTYTGLPNKAETEVHFNSDITPENDTEVSLGFDYIFVNGQESKVNLTLEVYDKDNILLNTYSGIEVPIERGKTTIVKGEYLTNRKEQGVGIDPGFDGEINIVLPD